MFSNLSLSSISWPRTRHPWSPWGTEDIEDHVAALRAKGHFLTALARDIHALKHALPGAITKLFTSLAAMSFPCL